MIRKEDLEDFGDVIMELRHAFNNPELENEIQELTANATASNRFQIKMEIINLSQEVQRVIDLRFFFKDSCEKFIYKGISHFLDDISKNEFENEISRYDGSYTLGVYEHIMQKAKKRYKLNPHALVNTLPKTEKIYLTKFFQRKNERLYFVKKVSIFYNNPKKMTPNVFNNFAIDAITTNISAAGLSIKIPKKNIRRTSGLIHIWMHGIEAEFKFSERVIITYEIKNTFEKNDHVYFNLHYHSNQFSKVEDEFIAFSKSYFEAEKKRNNLPVGNTVNAVKVKASEQFIITRLSSLPIFLFKQNDLWLPAAQFKTPNNSTIGLFGNANENNDFLHSLCLLPSIQSRISSGKRFYDYLFLMPIKDKNSESYYVAIPCKELICNGFLKRVARIAHKNKHLKLYRIDGNTTLPEEQYHVSSSLPSSAGEAFENMNQQPIEQAKSLSKVLKRMIVLSDFTDSIEHLNLLNDTSDKQENDFNLSHYILEESSKPVDIQDVIAETNDFRTEDRFLCNMNLLIQNKAHSLSEFVPCTTVNISTRGLKIKLSQVLDIKAGDKVLIHLVDLPGNGDKGVRYQPYYIIGKDSDLEYRLCIEGKAADHDGRKVIREFIHKNINSIKPIGYKNEIYGFSRVLRNIFANNIHLPHGITARHGSSRYIKNIAISESSHIPIIKNGSTDDLLTLMETDAFRNAVTDKIEFINKENPNEILYFIAMLRTRNNGDNYFFIKQITGSKTDAELMPLIQNLRCIGEPRLLRVKVTKKSRVFNKYFRAEMSYLERFAVPKVKDIMSELRNTMGVFEMSDVTDLIT
ncbi:PilZ domain-containing protein [Psychromonas aquimarina]|uniref:PilZ domain-containing protein n=1 Tax=Psychromonas aquimarina TaxID=444919 RepID=UPI00048B6CDB|nr:PilZ domain-containing protein [Psychromonas aquimarina]